MSGSAPWDPIRLARFSLYVDTIKEVVMGSVMVDEDNWYRFDTDDNITVNRIPRESAICVLSDGSEAGKRQLTVEKHGDHGETHASSSADHHHRHLHNHHKRGDRDLGHDPNEGQLGTLRKASIELPSSTQAGRQLQAGSFLIYLDADVTTDPNLRYSSWATFGSPTVRTCPPSAERLATLAAIVREDYAPFDVTVTSDRDVYYAWMGNRVRVGLISEVNFEFDRVRIGGGTCGAAWLDSYRLLDNLVWVVSCGTTCAASDQVVGQTISHEVGHTFDLRHDGSASDGEYFKGLPPKPPRSWPPGKRWNTIMGRVALFGMTQWSRGEYPGYGSEQTNPNDIQIITTAVGLRSNSYCDQVWTAGLLTY
jgi:hypothetical protein